MPTLSALGQVISNSTSTYLVWLNKYWWYQKYRDWQIFNEVLNYRHCYKTGKVTYSVRNDTHTNTHIYLYGSVEKSVELKSVVYSKQYLLLYYNSQS